MKIINRKSILSAVLLGLSGLASAADIEFYLPNGMVNNYPASAKLFVVTMDGKKCVIRWKQSACTVMGVKAHSSVARVDWYNGSSVHIEDRLASTAFTVRHEGMYTSIPLPVGTVHVEELTGTNPGAAANNIGLYLVPSSDLLKLPVTVGGDVNLPSNYYAGLKHYELSPSAVTYSSVVTNGNFGYDFPVLAGTYAPMAYQPNSTKKYNYAQAPWFLTEEQAVVVGKGTHTTIYVDSTDKKKLPIEIINNSYDMGPQ